MPNDSWHSQGTAMEDDGKLPVRATLIARQSASDPTKWGFEIHVQATTWECVAMNPPCKTFCLARSVEGFTTEQEAQRAAKAEWRRIQGLE